MVDSAPPFSACASRSTTLAAPPPCGRCRPAGDRLSGQTASASAGKPPCRRQCPGAAAPRHRRHRGRQHLQAHWPSERESRAERHARHHPGSPPLLTEAGIISPLPTPKVSVSLPQGLRVPDQGAGELEGLGRSHGEVENYVHVPAPLPLLGIGAAFGSIRRLRRLTQRIRDLQILV